MTADDTPAAAQADGEASLPVVHARERWQRTAVTAFFLAEARGFAPGHELDDWLAAERIVDSALIAAAVPTDDAAEAASLPAEPVKANRARRARKPSMKPPAAGAEPGPKKTAATARKTASRTRKSKPGIEADLGGIA